MKRRDPLEPFKSTYSEEDKMARLAVFAKQEGLVIQSSQPALSIGLIGVMPCLSEEDEPAWCIYGDLPACILNREMCPTPQDACGIYTWFFRQFVLTLGDGLDRGDLPPLRHWETGAELSQTDIQFLTPRLAWCKYTLLPTMLDRFTNPEVSERVERMGVFPHMVHSMEFKKGASQ